MSNTFGHSFRITTWGESHGRAVGVIIDGCPSGLDISEREIQEDLNKRRPGGRLATERREKDRVRILSGLFNGKTLGTPLSMIVDNLDVDSGPYEPLRDTPRPGHADFSWEAKYGIRDWRGGGRASARETLGRVAAGAIAKKLLSRVLGVSVLAYSLEIGGVSSDVRLVNKEGFLVGDISEMKGIVYSNPVRTLDLKKAKEMEKAISEARLNRDSVGGLIECVIAGVPTGLGEPVFDKLNADLAKAVVSIPAVKGVEFGAGFGVAKKRGSEINDEFIYKDGKIQTKTNHAGGINGGISNGMPIVLRVAVKPTSSIGRPQKTINIKTKKKTEIEITGRHDPCIVPRAVPVVESMVSLVLADHGLRSGLIPRRLV